MEPLKGCFSIVFVGVNTILTFPPVPPFVTCVCSFVLISVLLAALSDPVPNVRTVAATCLTPIVGFCDDSLINTKIRPRITEVCDATDLSVANEMDHDNDFRMQLRKLNSVLEA